MKYNKIPKQFFIEIKKWVDKGCPDPYTSLEDNPYGFCSSVGLCSNLSKYLYIVTGEYTLSGYHLIREMFDGEPYPFGEYDTATNLYLDKDEPSVPFRLTFIEENLK